MVSNWYRKPTKEIVIGQEIYHTVTDTQMFVRNIRVDSNGRPLFTLEYWNRKCSELIVARFEEIKEIF